MAILKRKLESQFFQKKISPGKLINEFINELDVMIQNLHNIPTNNPHKQQQQKNKIQHQQISYDNLLTTIQLNPSQCLNSPLNSNKKKKEKLWQISETFKT